MNIKSVFAKETVLLLMPKDSEGENSFVFHVWHIISNTIIQDDSKKMLSLVFVWLQRASDIDASFPVL
jgi:hypothetical protein